MSTLDARLRLAASLEARNARCPHHAPGPLEARCLRPRNHDGQHCAADPTNEGTQQWT